MNTLYERLVKFRNENRIADYKGIFKYDNVKDVVNQLLIISFNNVDKPDTLPNDFHITNVHFTNEELERLIKDIGYNVKAHMTTRNWAKGIASFEVTIVQK